ncbi:MAG TPA: histidine kinase dimerization/phospho-acceptor domain-containing protein [Candidatus Sulfotelmatobacter sp.]|nr:histidine kinase dimerization/phospho-acceptor domain-containing protein [Candidatus Sulfotelmatobacter sp.]
MSKRKKVWLAAVAGILATRVFAALVVPRSFGLTALSDVIDCLLLASGAAAFIPLALRSRGRMRMFWSLIPLGLVFWFGYQVFWTYYEIVLRREVPDLCIGDVVLFLHLVPLMAALALRPHAPRDEYAARLGRLDFALLLVWWFYLYVLIVVPWQYVVVDVASYDRNLNAVYLSENIAVLVGLLACWIASKGHWRMLYAGLFGMSFSYTLGSTLANWALSKRTYYTGCFYDIPLAISMAWLTWIGLSTKAEEPDADARETSTVYGVWVARCSMIAVFSLPLFAAWAMSDVAVSPRIRVFRLALTLAAAFLMGLMVFARQHLLDRELIRLLNQSRESFDNLQRLQAQILQSEKLASIGQLVGGAAHELNNPITAMLGYSDMLLSTQLTAEQQPLAAKIGQYVRRTKSLVASLISFARQTPAPKRPVDLNTLARTAVKLTQPQWKALGIEVQTEFDPTLPKVLGDSNQLLQVCLQLLANCLHVLNEHGGRILTVSTTSQAGMSVLQIATESIPVTLSADGPESSPVDLEDGLGLSACQGILQEHQGQISQERRDDGALLLRVELSVTESAPVKPKDSTVPVMWQSQPYA